jgi:hypothetical protein
MIIDFDEEKRARRRVALLEEMFTRAHDQLRRLRFGAEGVFVVLKSPGSDGKFDYQFVQEGISHEELTDILKRIATPLTLPK